MTLYIKKKARTPCEIRAKFGGGRSPRALSHSHNIGRLAFAGRVLPDATHRGMRCYRSHSGTVPVFSGRNLSSEASSPGSVPSADGELAGRVLARLQQCISRQHLATGTAPAFGRALAPCNGSDLLPLRLLSICSWVTRFYVPPQLGGFASFARLARSPPHRVPFAPRLVGRAFRWGGPTGTLRCVLVIQ